MRGAAIDDEKDRALRAGDQALQEREDSGIDAPFSMIISRIWPLELIAETRLGGVAGAGRLDDRRRRVCPICAPQGDRIRMGAVPPK